MKYCKCKCGQIVNKTWAKGHHRKGTTFKLSDEAKQKIRESQTGKGNSMHGKEVWNKGKTGMYSAETIRKIKKARAKQVITQEHKNKISLSNKIMWKKDPRYRGGEETKKERAVLNQHRREARKRLNGGSYTLQEWNDLLEKFDHMCLCCKRHEPEIKLTVDHIIPISIGGRNDIENIQPLCQSCNSRKSAKEIDYISLFYVEGSFINASVL